MKVSVQANRDTRENPKKLDFLMYETHSKRTLVLTTTTTKVLPLTDQNISLHILLFSVLRRPCHGPGLIRAVLVLLLRKYFFSSQ